MAIVSPAEVAEFQERGFLVARPLLNSNELDDLRAAFEDLKEGRSAKEPELSRNLTGDEENFVLQIVNAWEAEPAFERHLFHPKLTEAISALMGAEVVRVWHDQIQYKPPRNGGPTVWHQDYPYWPVLAPADLVSAWVALEDADEGNGCMSMVPGSHRWGAYKDGTIGLRKEDWGPDFHPGLLPTEVRVEVVPCPVRAGEVMFHHCMTWHGAPPNRSERGRPAIAVHYMPGWTRFVPKSGHAVDHLIEVAPGEVLEGTHFPTVFDRQPLSPDAAESTPEHE